MQSLKHELDNRFRQMAIDYEEQINQLKAENENLKQSLNSLNRSKAEQRELDKAQ